MGAVAEPTRRRSYARPRGRWDAFVPRRTDFRGIAAGPFSELEKGGRANRALPDAADGRGDARFGSSRRVDSGGPQKVAGAGDPTLRHARNGVADSVLEGGGRGMAVV